MAGEYTPYQDFHPVLLGQEPAGCIRYGGRVVADLEGGNGPDVEPDALLRDAVFDDLRLAQGQR